VEAQAQARGNAQADAEDRADGTFADPVAHISHAQLASFAAAIEPAVQPFPEAVAAYLGHCRQRVV
jgi:hypothetical protein